MNLSIKLPFAITHRITHIVFADRLMFIERNLLFFSLVWFRFNISIYKLRLLLFVGNVNTMSAVHDESHTDSDISSNWQKKNNNRKGFTNIYQQPKQQQQRKTTWPMGKFAFEMQQSRLQLLLIRICE